VESSKTKRKQERVKTTLKGQSSKVLDKGSKVWFKSGSYGQMLRKFLKSGSLAQVRKLGLEVPDYLENRL